MDVVKKWNIHFHSLKNTQDGLFFLEELEEKASCYQIEKNDLIKAMPEFLRGKALEWYRNNKEPCPTWRSFKEAFSRFFFPRKLRTQLEDEVVARVQGTHESINDYVIAIQTLMRAIPTLTKQQQLDRIYENSRSEYKMYAKRHEFRTLDKFLALAETFAEQREFQRCVQGTGVRARILEDKNFSGITSNLSKRQRSLPQKKNGTSVQSSETHGSKMVFPFRGIHPDTR